MTPMPQPSSSTRPSPIPAAAVWLVVFVFAFVALRCAWMSDDSYLTFRTIDNVVNGYGPTWNTGERVQAYTHPLWMLLMSLIYLVSREAFTIPMLASVALGTAAVWVVGFRVGKAGVYGFLGVLALLMSRSVVDYTTSGLENPLSHVLMALFAADYLDYEQRASADRQRFTRLVLLGALLTLNRLDLVLLVAPAIAHAARGLPVRDVVRSGLLGLSPLLAWEAFSLVYYGSFIPNTGVAKLYTGFPKVMVWRQGAAYLLHQMQHDPVSAAVVAAAILHVARLYRRPAQAALGIGVALYILYVAKVGGDFMAGRFFTTPTIAAVCALVSARRDDAHDEGGGLVLADAWMGAAAIVVLGLTAPTPAIVRGQLDAKIYPNGVVDERQFWGESHSLLNLRRHGRAPYHGTTGDGRRVRKREDKLAIRQAVGAFGYHAGPEVYIVDRYALGDAFLARLPAMRMGGYGRPGHSERFSPPGYLRWIDTGEADMLDPAAQVLFDDVRLVVAGPLFSTERWRAIWRLNTGESAGGIDHEFYQKPYYPEVPSWTVARPKPEGHGWDQPGSILVDPEHGIRVVWDEPARARVLRIAVDADDEYKLEFSRRGRSLGHARIKPAKGKRGGMRERDVKVPKRARKGGFDSIVFHPLKRRRTLAVGHILLGPDPKDDDKASKDKPKKASKTKRASASG